MCVADGVSQGRHSQVAAETAARAACKLALDGAGDVGSLDWTALANRVSRRILDEARYRRLVDLGGVDDPAEQIRTVRRAMSTTAVVALVARRPHLGSFPFLVAVLAGDSGAYVLRNERFAILAGGKDPDGTGVADGSVRPLPGPADPVVVTSALTAGEVLLLTSDGVGDPIGDGTGDVGAELARRWQKPPTAAQLFTDVNFLRRSYDDDRTAVGVWVLPEAEVAR
jgi:serine/threonine protein phosphatase PrpC